MAVIAFHIHGICLYWFGIKNTPGTPTPSDIVTTLFSAGHVGVNVFFAISGFVVMLPFAKGFFGDGPEIGARSFYSRRLSRMLPPYVIHLLFLFILCVVVLRRSPQHPHLYHNDAWLSYTLKHLVPSLFFVNGFVYAAHPYPNVVLWALEAEIQFYLLAPFLAGVFRISDNTRRRALLVAMIIFFSVLPHFFSLTTLRRFLILNQLQHFLPGFLIADLYLTGAITGSEKKGAALWDLLFLLASVSLVLAALHPSIVIIEPWLVLLICIGTLEGKLFRRLLSLPWITGVGGMCYTIYMYHLFMISVLVRFTIHLRTGIQWLDLLIQLAVMSVAILPACTVLYLRFERPFMKPDWPAHLRATIKRQALSFRIFSPFASRD